MGLTMLGRLKCIVDPLVPEPRCSKVETVNEKLKRHKLR